ncbi:hypothetical protein AB0F13_03015 [Streptomyces sp. NPDC026206]
MYLIADPYTGQCHAHTQPKDGEYRTDRTLDFGDPFVSGLKRAQA